MDDSAGPSAQPNSPGRRLVQREAITPTESIPPTPHTQGDIPLLPLEPFPLTPSDGLLPVPQPNNRTRTWRPRGSRAVKRFHIILLGAEKGSVFSYMSFLAMTGGMLIAFSSIFGWPQFPIWAFLRG